MSYPELCVACKSEEQRQAELKRRQQYRRAEQMKNDARIPLSASQFSQANGSKGAKGAKGSGHHPYLKEDPESAIHVAALSI